MTSKQYVGKIGSIKIYKDRKTKPMTVQYKGFSQTDAGAYYAPYVPNSMSPIKYAYRDTEGAFHNNDGPAIIYENGELEWFIHGDDYSFDEWATTLDKSIKERAILLLKYG